jgi:hypothetical protein
VEEKNTQELLLKSAQRALSRHEDSSVQIILTAVANAMALLKSHLSDLDVQILYKDFTVDETECEALTTGAYDTAHEFASSYDFSWLSPRIMIVLGICNFFLYAVMNNLLLHKCITLTFPDTCWI